MAAPNQGPTYFCRGSEAGALYGGKLGRLLEKDGCVEGGASYNFRPGNHPCCKACRKLVDPEYPKGNGAWFLLEVDTVKTLHADANFEDEANHEDWLQSQSSSSARRRSRSPPGLAAVGHMKVKDCSAEQLMLWIRAMR